MSTTMRQHLGTIRKSCFGDNPIRVMDFFLDNVGLYFTPKTAALSMEMAAPTAKDIMRLLKQNSYLSKLSDMGTVYFITKENMEFWRTDFKNHVLLLAERSSQP